MKTAPCSGGSLPNKYKTLRHDFQFSVLMRPFKDSSDIKKSLFLYKGKFICVAPVNNKVIQSVSQETLKEKRQDTEETQENIKRKYK